jgi:hypothetical protein
VFLPVMVILLADADSRIHHSRLTEPAHSKVEQFLIEHKQVLLGAVGSLCTILPVALPISTFFVLRAGVRRSSAVLMERVWRTNHNITWIVGMFLVVTLFVIDHNLSDGLEAVREGCEGLEDKFECAAYRSAQTDYHYISVGFLTCLAVTLCLHIVLGTFATSLANNVLECMAKGMVFAGAPPVPREVLGEVADPSHFCVGKVVQKTSRHVKINPQPTIEVVGLPAIQVSVQPAPAGSEVPQPALAESAPEAQAPTAGPADTQNRRSWRSVLGLLGRGASRREADDMTPPAAVMV